MFGIYIHFPYCVHKCSYCDFYSIENLNSRNKFIENLQKEIVLRTELYGDKIHANTLFFGGGTPSLMKPHHIEKIFESLHQNIDFSDNTEMTMECNPGTIDIKNLSVYKSFGINRISFGVQSFIDRDLKFLERIHSPDDVRIAIDTARKVGFDNISLDLMFALPNQTKNDWEYNLSKAIELDPNHISAYSLIYEPGTPLYKDFINNKVNVIEEDLDVELYETTYEYLSRAGYNQYEISNYSKPAFECKHNLKYWSSDEYFGFGPSAHGYINGIRYWNYRSNDKYFNLLANNILPTEGSEILNDNQKAFEDIYLGLRSLGLNFTEFKMKYGIDILEIKSKILNEFAVNGFLKIEGNFIKLTNKGYFVSDNITVELSKVLDNSTGQI